MIIQQLDSDREITKYTLMSIGTKQLIFFFVKFSL